LILFINWLPFSLRLSKNASGNPLFSDSFLLRFTQVGQPCVVARLKHIFDIFGRPHRVAPTIKYPIIGKFCINYFLSERHNKKERGNFPHSFIFARGLIIFCEKYCYSFHCRLQSTHVSYAEYHPGLPL